MRLTTSSCRLGGTISARMKRWPLSGSTVGWFIGLPAFADAPVWCRKRSRWSTPQLHCLPPTTSMEQQQNSPCHCVFNTLGNSMDWVEANLPYPLYTAANINDTRYHVTWQLAASVCKTEKAERKP